MLFKQDDYPLDWDCDKLRGARKCFSGQLAKDSVWRCDDCNFNLCINCMQVESIMA